MRRTNRSLGMLGVLAAVAVLSFTPGAFGQTCPPPGTSGGNGGTGGGGATLKTITLDGIQADWTNVLANGIQTTVDGQHTDPCTLANPIDRDCTIFGYRQISGRDLAKFSWTYDSSNIYLYLERYGSTNNQQSFFFYADTGSNQRMNTNERVLQVSFSGANGTLDSSLHTYTAIGGIKGDAAGDFMADPVSGFADGYLVGGSLSAGPTIDNNQSWVWADGTGFEARIPWASLGVPAGTAVYFHVSSMNGGGINNVPSGIDDNLGGPNGRIGVFAFLAMNFSPNRSSSVPFGTPYAEYTHTLTNTGKLPDYYNFVGYSSLGWGVDIYDSTSGSPGTLMASDTNGDGTWNSVTGGYDGDANNRPQTPTMLPAATFLVTVRIYPPPGANFVQDVSIISAVSAASTACSYASVTDTTAIGDLALVPTPQAKSVMPSQTVDYGLTLQNFSLADTFDMTPISSTGWRIDLYTDPNGDGNPADGVLVATDLNGNGVFTDPGDSILPANDTNANGKPDFGSVINGGTMTFVVRITASGTVGAVDVTTVTALGATFGKQASAILTTTVRDRLDLFPSYTVALGTNLFSGPDTSVFYSHTLINSWGATDAITLTAVSSLGYTTRIFSDPNGDGNPADGVLITTPQSLAGNGGTLRFVVEVVIPAGVAFGTIDTTTVTATSGLAPAVTDTVSDQVRISRVASFSDPLRTLAETYFARCSTIYIRANNLTPDTTTTYQVNYLNPSMVSVRNVNITSDGNGEGIDQYTFGAADPLGVWTVRLMQGVTVLDTITVTLDPAATPSTISPLTTDQTSYAVSGENVTVSATFNNTSIGATFFGTVFRYVIVNAAGTQYLQSGGTFAAYSGAELTRTTSPHDVAPLSSVTETFTINGVVFPAAGIYEVRASWVGSCGNIITTAIRQFVVGATLGSFEDAGLTIPREFFGTGQTVFLGGSNYLASTGYKVAYYNPSGVLAPALTQSVTSTGSGALSTSITTAALVTNGQWRAVVYPSASPLPGTFAPADPAILSSDTFTVDTVSPGLTIVKPTAISYNPSDDENAAVAGFQLTPNGTMELDATVSITSVVANSGGPAPVLGAVSYPTTTTWTVPQATWPAGNYTLTVQAADSAGNTASQNVTFSILPPPPIVDSPILAGATSVSGTSTQPVGSVITVYRNGLPIGVTAVLPGGIWTLSSIGPLADGDAMRATVAAGGVTSGLSATVYVSANPADVTPRPTVTSPILAGATSIPGTSSSPAGTIIDVFVDGVWIGTTAVAPGGTWTLAGIGPLQDGQTVIATATDLANNLGTSAPSAPVVVSGNVPDQTPSPTITAPVLTGSTSISGTSSSPAGTRIDVYANGVYLGTTTTGAGGAWTLSGLTPLTLGTVLTATATDNANSRGTSAPSAPVIVTGVVPPAPIVGSPIYAGAASITGTSVSAAGSMITVYNNGLPIGTTTVLADGTWTLSGVTGLVDGNSITAIVTVSGVPSALSPPVIVSSNPPDVTPTPTVNSPIFAGATSVSGTSTAPVGTTINVYVDGVSIGTTTVTAGGVWTLSSIGPLVDGQAVFATATDTANNHGTSAPSATVYVSANAGDATPPPVVNSPIISGLTTVSGTSTQQAGTLIAVYVNGVIAGQTTVSPTGTWVLTGIPPMASGDIVTATATNLAAGLGTSTPSAPVIVQPAPPIVTSPIQAGATSVSGTSAQPDGSMIDVYDNGILIGTVPVVGGSWTLGAIGPLVDGHTITATVTVGVQTSALSGPVVVSGGAPDVTGTPAVTGPIGIGSTCVSGTSAEPPGTVISVYVNLVYVGTTTVLPTGTWTLCGVGPLSSGDAVTATATDTFAGQGTSTMSPPVIVGPAPPTVNSPILAGATQVTGTSTEPAGSVITVYVNAVPVGTAVVQLGGGWQLGGIGPLVDGQSITATVTVGGQTSGLSQPVIVSSGPADQSPPPVIDGPIIHGTTTITGTSAEPPGTTITVYVNGVPVGTTTVQPGGTWTFTVPISVVTGDIITATATDTAGGNGTSVPSAPIVVQPAPPNVSGPITEGATTVTGTSIEPPGSTITVYVNGLPVGTTTVQSNGTWSLPGVGPLVDGQTVTATVSVGPLVSGPSGPVIVSSDPNDVTPPPVITGPVPALSTSVSGTGLPGATVSLYSDGVYIGTAVVTGGGGWTISSLSPLPPGAILTATQILGPAGTSAPSAPVVVGPAPNLLRNDSVTANNPMTPVAAIIFPRKSSGLPAPSLDAWGANGYPQVGEGTLTQANGSSDDDAFYMATVTSGVVDPDPTVLSDNGRPLVFYELVDGGQYILKLAKDGSGGIVITWTP